MRKPKNNYERKLYKETCIASYEQENAEIVEHAPNVEDFYYTEHLGVWILTFKKGDDMEFDTKAEMMEWIKSEP